MSHIEGRWSKMILSKLYVDAGHPSIRQALRNCQDMHKNLMKAFREERAQSGVLYTVSKKRDRIEIYVLSNEEPQWAALETNGYHCIGVKDISALQEMYAEGSAFRFELSAYPAKKIRGIGKNSKRVFLRTAEERSAWMERQAEKNGFRIVSLQELGQTQEIYGQKGQDDIRYNAVKFVGMLEIVDQAAFWNGYTRGIGSGKAYGLGMLMISRG